MQTNSPSIARPDLVLEVMQDLRKLVRALEGYSRSAEARFGLTGPQLWALWELGRGVPLSLKELASRMHLTSSTLVGVIDRLMAKGLVSREVDPEDRRRISLTLTAKGRKLWRQAPDPAQGRMIEGLEGLSARRLAALHGGLQDVLRMMDADRIEARVFFSED